MRTAVAYQLEPERYDVKVTIKPREGSRHVSHQLGLSGFAEPWVFEQRSFDASSDAQSATFRLPPGTYSTGAISYGQARDGAREGVVTYDPTFSVSKNTEIVLDENAARRFDYKVDKPVVDDGAILDVGWDGDAGYTGFTFFGAVDRVYAQPSKDLTGGSATVAANWLLSQPEGLISPSARCAGAVATAHCTRRQPHRDAGGPRGPHLPDRRRRQRGEAPDRQGRQGRGGRRVRHLW